MGTPRTGPPPTIFRPPGDACLFYQWHPMTLKTVSPYQQLTRLSMRWEWPQLASMSAHAPRLPVPRGQPLPPQGSLCWRAGQRINSSLLLPFTFHKESPQSCSLPSSPFIGQEQQCWEGQGSSAPITKKSSSETGLLSEHPILLVSSSHSGHWESSVLRALRPRERRWLV